MFLVNSIIIPFEFSTIEFLTVPVTFFSLSPTISSMIFGVSPIFTVYPSSVPSLNFINILLSFLWQPLLETWNSICSHTGPWGNSASRESPVQQLCFLHNTVVSLSTSPSPICTLLSWTNDFSCGTTLKCLNQKHLIFYNSFVKKISSAR